MSNRIGNEHTDIAKNAIGVKVKKSWEEPKSRQRRIDGIKSCWDQEHRMNAGELTKKRWQDPEYRKVMIVKMTVAANLPERKKTLKEASKRNWDNPEFVWKVMHRRDMSGGEQVLLGILESNEFPYAFTGNGAYMVGRKNPDFVRISKDAVIELWGDYFHKGQDPQERISFFAKHGYKCLVIWASELVHSNEVVSKIRMFEEES